MLFIVATSLLISVTVTDIEGKCAYLSSKYCKNYLLYLKCI